MQVRLMLISLVLLFVGCDVSAPDQANNNLATRPSGGSDPSDMPREVLAAAQTALIEAYARDRRVAEQFEFVVNSADLTAADRANGITGKWCVKASFIFRRSPQEQYQDRRDVAIVTRDETGMHALAGPRMTLKDEEEARAACSTGSE